VARIVKTAEVRQDEILDVAHRLFLAKGYADTPIQSIIDEVGIAKGTFYHHYPSKSDLLDALVRRVVAGMAVMIDPIVADPALSAVQKLERVYQGGLAWKYDRREFLIDLVKAMQSDGNVLLMRRIERDSVAWFVPKLADIITQGVAEGSFDTEYPLNAAHAVYQLGMLFAALRDAVLDESRPLPTTDEVRTQVVAFHDAVERVIGAKRGSLALIDAGALVKWVDDEAIRRSS
jgi:AcrR family transcriptional regulator